MLKALLNFFLIYFLGLAAIIAALLGIAYYVGKHFLGI